MKSTRIRRLRLAALLVPVLVLSLGGGAGASLPPIANDEAHAHATHGPDGLALDKRGRSPGAAVPGLYSVDDHAVWDSCQYDRASLLSDYTGETAGQNEALPQVHAVYVYPSKTTSRFLQFAAMFQADARQSSVLLQTLGRDVRWDLRPAELPLPSGFCGSTTTLLDITVFKSKYTAQQLSTPRQFSLVATELAKSGKFSALNKKYVVWLDAGSQYCGQGTLWQDTERSIRNVSTSLGQVDRVFAVF